MRQISLLFIALTLMLTSCIKEEDFENITDKQIDPEELVQTTLYGLVKDQNDQIMQGAEVSLYSPNGEKITYADSTGYFYFDSVLVTRSAYLRVFQDGYFDASRRLVVQEDKYNYTVIQMMERKLAGTVVNSSGGTLELPDGSAISLPENGVAYEDGTPYSGTVRVMMNRIDPSSPDLFEQMPGNLSGYGEDGNESALASYGMMMVELESTDGTLLQMAEGKEATMDFVVPDAMLADAPSEIPMWYFNEAEGYWYEEGKAVLENGRYVGFVSHFTTWNCDRKGEVIDISGTVGCDGDVLMVPYLRVYLYQEDAPIAGGYLTANGAFTFLNFFANEVFTIKVLDHCDDIIYENEYGPYTEDTELGDITIDDCGESVNISGNAVNCDGEAVDQGVIQLFTDAGEIYKMDFENGSFELNTVSCLEPEMIIVITDVNAQKSSQPVSFSTENGDVDLGSIEVCDELDEYFIIYYKLPDGDTDQDTILFLDPTFNSYENEGHFIEFSNDIPDSTNFEGGSLGFNWNDLQMGTNFPNSFYYSYGEQGVDEYSVQYNNWTMPPLPDFEVEILQLDLNQNGLIKGTFEGDVKTNLDEIKTISGKFKVRVD